jgi:hypothetical protein
VGSRGPSGTLRVIAAMLVTGASVSPRLGPRDLPGGLAPVGRRLIETAHSGTERASQCLYASAFGAVSSSSPGFGSSAHSRAKSATASHPASPQV